jgi:hypothetical protein
MKKVLMSSLTVAILMVSVCSANGTENETARTDFGKARTVKAYSVKRVGEYSIYEIQSIYGSDLAVRASLVKNVDCNRVDFTAKLIDFDWGEQPGVGIPSYVLEGSFWSTRMGCPGNKFTKVVLKSNWLTLPHRSRPNEDIGSVLTRILLPKTWTLEIKDVGSIDQ